MEKLKVKYAVGAGNEILDKMKEAYLECAPAVKYIKELGVPEEMIDDNIATIYNFVCDVNYCKKCPGMKKCVKNNALLVNKLVFKGGYLDSQLVPCKELLNRVTFERQFEVADFNEEWLDTNLKDIDKTKDRAKALKKYVDFIKTGIPTWIYLTGGQNSGRSYFAASIAVDAAKREKGPICFLNSASRIREIAEASKKNDEFQKLIDLYSNTPILVLDDFGNEYINDFIRDGIIYQIISNRASKKLFTIFTSDFSLDEIETLYSTSKAGALRAKQIVNNIKNNAGEEIDLGDLSVYR